MGVFKMCILTYQNILRPIPFDLRFLGTKGSSATAPAFLKEVLLEIHFFTSYINAVISFFCSPAYFNVLFLRSFYFFYLFLVCAMMSQSIAESLISQIFPCPT